MTTTVTPRGNISDRTRRIDPPQVPPNQSSVLADLVREIEDYPHTHLTLAVAEVDPTTGNALSQREEATFAIEVANSGPLHVHDLTVLVEGLNGTKVKTSGALDFDFRTELTTGVFDRVSAHQSNTPTRHPGGVLLLKAPNRSLPVTDLVRVSIKDWRTDLDHITDAHSDPDPAARAVYSAEVLDE